MRFRRWPRPTPFEDNTRKRAALIRKQRLEREALPLFSTQIAVQQPDVDGFASSIPTKVSTPASTIAYATPSGPGGPLGRDRGVRRMLR